MISLVVLAMAVNLHFSTQAAAGQIRGYVMFAMGRVMPGPKNCLKSAPHSSNSRL
jgi:hypothetical protein